MAGDKIQSSVNLEGLTSTLHPHHTALSLDVLSIVDTKVSLETDSWTLCSCAAGSVKIVIDGQAFVCVHLYM